MICQFGQCENKPSYKIRLAFWVFACEKHLEDLHIAWPKAIVFDSDASDPLEKRTSVALEAAPVSLFAYGRI